MSPKNICTWQADTRQGAGVTAHHGKASQTPWLLTSPAGIAVTKANQPTKQTTEQTNTHSLCASSEGRFLDPASTSFVSEDFGAYISKQAPDSRRGLWVLLGRAAC